jgi:uncharacterized membrane protein
MKQSRIRLVGILALLVGAVVLIGAILFWELRTSPALMPVTLWLTVLGIALRLTGRRPAPPLLSSLWSVT